MAAQPELSDGERTVLQRAMEIVSSITSSPGPSGSEAGNGSGHSLASASHSRGLGGQSSSAVGMSPTPHLSSRPGTSKQSLSFCFVFCFVL